MAHTTITIALDGSVLVPSSRSVQVTSGDSVSFASSGAAHAVLFFSPDAVSVLSPAPSGPVALQADTPVNYSFTSSKPGAYSVFFEPTADTKHPDFPVRESNSLLLEIDSTARFGGPVNPIKTSDHS